MTPAKNHIDGLKDAIKAKWDANMPEKANALLMRIFTPGTDTVWKEVSDPEKKLEANSAKTAYGFVLE